MSHTIRVAALDHFSGQDLDALITAGGDRFRWRIVPYWHLRDAANRIFPVDVQSGLAAWGHPELEDERREFARWTTRGVRRLYREWPFDVFLLPSDTYYYVRYLPQACHQLGLPVFVTQKETTITDSTLAEHAPAIGQEAAFISDWMTVCSDRHRQFWIAAGADPDLIEVTGQPRFDLYANAQPAGARSGLPTVLFLSYDHNAYIPLSESEGADWLDLRSESEDALLAASKEGVEVTIKLHPLQSRDEEEKRLLLVTSRNDGIRLAPEGADTRRLILASDAVVGFQTTALYEAMIAGKPIAYTAWGRHHDRLAEGLIPFHEHPELLDVVPSAAALREWLLDPPAPAESMAGMRRRFVEEMLGPVDGRASARTLAAIERIVGLWEPAHMRSPARAAAGRLAIPEAVWTTSSVLAQIALWSAIATVSKVVHSERMSTGAAFRRQVARARLRVAIAALLRRSVR